MSAYSVELVKSARREFERLPVTVRGRITEALQVLAQNPYSELLKVKKMKGASDLYRVRVGDYRVLYELHDQRLIILVIKIGHRSEVYKR